MSICSNASSMVSYAGSEMPLDEAIDDIYKELQRSLNDSQVALRSLSMLQEQDNDFKESVELSDQIFDDIVDMMVLFKELKSVCRQVVNKPSTDEEKNWFQAHTTQRKLDLEAKKNNKE